jgi:hypothetical protein
MPDGLSLLGVVGRLLGPLWNWWKSFRAKDSRRKKLYAEMTEMFERVVGLVRTIKENPQLEAGSRNLFVGYVKAPYFIYINGRFDEFTDVPDWKAINVVYEAFTRIPTAPNDEILILAEMAVYLFEDSFLRGRIDQTLVLEAASVRIRQSLEVVRRGDWKSVLDPSVVD